MRRVSKIQIKFEDNMWSQKVRYIFIKNIFTLYWKDKTQNCCFKLTGLDEMMSRLAHQKSWKYMANVQEIQGLLRDSTQIGLTSGGAIKNDCSGWRDVLIIIPTWILRIHLIGTGPWPKLWYYIYIRRKSEYAAKNYLFKTTLRWNILRSTIMKTCSAQH